MISEEPPKHDSKYVLILFSAESCKFRYKLNEMEKIMNEENIRQKK